MASIGKHKGGHTFKAGSNWVRCQKCGMDVRAEDARKQYDGLIVCREDYDTRHPQELVRSLKERTAAKLRTSSTENTNVPDSWGYVLEDYVEEGYVGYEVP